MVARGDAVHRFPGDLTDKLGQRLTILHPQSPLRIHRLGNCRIPCGRPPVGIQEDTAKEVDAVEFVHPEQSRDIYLPRHLRERQRRQVVPDQRDVRREARHALVHVLERLEVRQLNHGKERLLEGVLDIPEPRQHAIETLFDPLRERERLEGGPGHGDCSRTQSPAGARVGQQIPREQRVKAAERMPIEIDLGRTVHQKLDRRPVIQDHPCIGRRLPWCLAAKFQQALRIEQRVGVSFEPAGVPGQVDQEAGEYLTGVSAGRQVGGGRRLAQSVQPLPLSRRQIRLVGTVVIEEVLAVPDGCPRLERLDYMGLDLPGRLRQMKTDLSKYCDSPDADGSGSFFLFRWTDIDRRDGGFRDAITRTAPCALDCKPPASDENPDAVLHGPARNARGEASLDLGDR